MGWLGPWNVGEDAEGQLAQGFGGKQIAQLAPNFANGPFAQGMQLARPQMAQFAPPPPQFQSPQQAAQWCAQYPQHPAAGQIMAQLAQALQGGLGVRMAVDGMFSPEQFYRSMPTKTRLEQLPLSQLSAIAAGGAGVMSVVVQKPFKGIKLSIFGDHASFQITSITAAGQTVTAASGNIPASRYALVDSLPNIALPALTAGASITISATNTSGVAGNLSAVLDGETGEA